MIPLFLFVKQKTAYEMRISDWSSDVCSSDLVLRQLREELAFQYLQRGMCLSEIAYLLGFSDNGTFSRAFKQWTGRRPSSVLCSEGFAQAACTASYIQRTFRSRARALGVLTPRRKPRTSPDRRM